MMDRLQALRRSQVDKQSDMPLIMGVLNVTPDSFSDGGRYASRDAVLRQLDEMVSGGADIVDIGGESTRPGAEPVGLQEELERVMPVIEWVKSHCELAISVDTYKSEVMHQVLAAGVDLINDINALQAPGALDVVAQSEAYVCLMHKQGNPQSMQSAPSYTNVVDEVLTFLHERVQVCEAAGVAPEKIVLDPGFGFGKSLTHNVELFRHLPRLTNENYPVLVGVSRKSMIGALAGDLSVEQRMVASIAAALVAAEKGAAILRVHDVRKTVEALRVATALQG